MEPERTISVAIATYNRSAMVGKAVASALAQSRPPLEIVVADDASTDDTADVLASAARGDARVRVFRQPVNTGGVRNWNAAIDETRGDLIAWCSDDDWFCPEHLARSAAYLEAHPEVGLVHSHFIDSIEISRAPEQPVTAPVTASPIASPPITGPRPLRSRAPLVIFENPFLYLMRYYNWPFHPSTIVMRRPVWNAVGPFDPAYALADTDWFVRAVEQFPIALLPAYGVYNRRHAGNWSNRVGSARMQSEIFEIVERSLARRWPAGGARRAWWRFLWRNTVRLRLLLTIRARIQSGHAEAACAAWRVLTCETGCAPLAWFERMGASLIRRLTDRGSASSREAPGGNVRESVSPL